MHDMCLPLFAYITSFLIVAVFQFTELEYSANEADRFLCEAIQLVSGVLTFPISVTVVTNPSLSPTAATRKYMYIDVICIQI